MEILTVVEDENGNIILGTDGDGIYIVNESKTVHINTENGLNSDVVMKIKKDIKKNIFWIITSNSISYMNSLEHSIKTIHNFSDSNYYDLVENDNSKMWILSSNGIYIVTVKELLENKEIVPVFYGLENGLSYIPTANSYSELMDDGTFFIAGCEGVEKTARK